jgi:hypothetical protein
MATQGSMRGEQLLVQVGDGGSPENFTHYCSINQQRGMKHTASTTTTGLVDCANPDAPTTLATDVDDLGTTVDGAGVMNPTDYAFFYDWWASGLAKNCKVKDTLTGAQGGQTISGAFKLTSLEKTGQRRKKVTVAITLMSDGATTRTQNP